MTPAPNVESIPADLDRFLGNFFSRRGWRSEIKYDPTENQLYLDVRLADGKLSVDDRFFSLVEYFARAQDSVLRQRSGLPLQCRVFASDGSDLTGVLHTRGSGYLDDAAQGLGMRRRLMWLGVRRRFLARILPGALMWAFAFYFVVAILGMSFDVAVIISIGALAVQVGVLFVLAGRRP